MYQIWVENTVDGKMRLRTELEDMGSALAAARTIFSRMKGEAAVEVRHVVEEIIARHDPI